MILEQTQLLIVDSCSEQRAYPIIGAGIRGILVVLELRVTIESYWQLCLALVFRREPPKPSGKRLEPHTLLNEIV